MDWGYSEDIYEDINNVICSQLYWDPGRLLFFNGDAAKLTVGKTELALDAWNHVVLVRDGKQIEVYLDGGGSSRRDA